MLIASIRGSNSSPRVRLWRQMKALGAASLVDGAYLLPALPALQQQLGNLREELIAAGGSAHVLRVREETPARLAE
ncbi:Chromate resistance protein ChrB [Chromobacterium violaceum]|uniref:Chromate resistance protein ChrB n=1 Tax=Chromobacterium violaceum TaxID=536 RepID=UPI001CE1875B|nr:Chromate resistance protein ChrB [Chromobacterium violaceum]